MRFVCRQQNLLQGLSQVASLAGKNKQLPILNYVLCQAKEGVLTLTCTDLEVGAQVIVAGKVEGEGVCVVNARKVLEYVQQLPGTHPLELHLHEDRRLSITTQGFEASFPLADTEEFPLLPAAPHDTPITIPMDIFCTALTDTVFAAAREETRPELRSIFVRGADSEIRLAATDSFRLAEEVITLETPVEEFSFLLPLSAAQEVIRLFSDQEAATLHLHSTYVVFRAEGRELSSRLVEGTYPNYQQIIPTHHRVQGMLEKAALGRALKTLAVFLPRDSRRIQLLIRPDEKTMYLQVGGEVGQGKVQLPWTSGGEPIDVLFNVQYLLEGVLHLPGNECELSFGSATEPMVMRPGDKARTYVYVVMPIQV